MLYVKWLLVLILAYFAGILIKKCKLPSILGWLIAGMLLGPEAANLLSNQLRNTSSYQLIICWMQCAFGIMLGSELIVKRLRTYGKALFVTTLTQSLGTFVIVSVVFGIIFALQGVPIYLALVFGGIALATAPAPALSIVREFNTHGPVTDTLLPMAVLDDVVGIVVFFSVNAFVAHQVASGSLPLYMIPVMIFLPILLGGAIGYLVGLVLRKSHDTKMNLIVLLLGITVIVGIGVYLNKEILEGITLNYMLMGVAYSGVLSNMIDEEKLQLLLQAYNPILAISLLISIVDLGAPLDYHLILGAGFYTFVYIVARAAGKNGGARLGATIMHMPETVKKYLGLTLLPHSGVSLVFTSIACAALQSALALVRIVQGTIAAAAVINEIIAVIAAKKGFELAGELK